MIFPFSILQIADNSGAHTAMCIRVLGHTKTFASIGDIVVATIKTATPNAPIKCSEVVYGLVVRTKRPFKRFPNKTIQFEENAIVLITREKSPRSSRIRGFVPMELKKKFPKLMSLIEQPI